MPLPWIYALEGMAFAAVTVGLLHLWTFIAATPIAELDLRGRSLPAIWDHAIRAHGQYYRGFDVGGHPVRFVVVLAVVVAAGIATRLINTAIRSELEVGGETRRGLHDGLRMVAGGVWLGFVMVLAHFTLTRTLPQ